MNFIGSEGLPELTTSAYINHQTCPHCGKPIPKSLAASTLGSIKSPKRSAASRANGKLGGRPKLPTTVPSTERLVTCRGQHEPHIRTTSCQEPVVEARLLE